MKAFVFGGAGTLGSTSAFLLAKEGLYDEIVLCDTFAPKAKNHAMDMGQAVWASTQADIRSGELSDMDGADLVISAFGIPQSNPGAWSYDDTQHMLPILTELCDNLRTRAPEAAVITMTNPVDAINYAMHKLSGLPRERFLGYSFNDSLRMRWGISRYLGIPASDIHCVSMGEHGPTKVQIYSCAEVNGKPYPFTPEQTQEIDATQKAFWDEYLPLGSLRTAGWTSAMGILELAEHIQGRRTGYVGCSCVLDGEYGLHGLSVGVPAHLGPGGVQKVEELPLTDQERQGFLASAEKISGVLRDAFPML